MRKILAIILTAVFALSLAACGASGGGNTSGSGTVTPGPSQSSDPKTIAEDTTILAMSFNPPADFKSVKRTIGRYADGSFEEKEIDYFLDDEEETMLGFAFAPGINLTDYYTLDELESATCGDKTFYFVQTGTETVAIAQDGDNIYAIDYKVPDGDGTDYVKQVIANDISFTNNKDTVDNREDIPGIKYSLDGTGTLSEYTNLQNETPDGEITEQILSWSYGNDPMSPDYRFAIYYYKDTSFDDVKSEDRVYEERDVNGITYIARIPDDEDPYAYYFQQGDDLYLIMNTGTSNGLWTTRSDESRAAFDTFLKSVSFD